MKFIATYDVMPLEIGIYKYHYILYKNFFESILKHLSYVTQILCFMRKIIYFFVLFYVLMHSLSIYECEKVNFKKKSNKSKTLNPKLTD